MYAKFQSEQELEDEFRRIAEEDKSGQAEDQNLYRLSHDSSSSSGRSRNQGRSFFHSDRPQSSIKQSGSRLTGPSRSREMRTLPKSKRYISSTKSPTKKHSVPNEKGRVKGSQSVTEKGVFKKNRKTTSALQELAKDLKRARTERCLPRAPFQRLVKEIAEALLPGVRFQSGNTKKTLSKCT